MHSTVAWRCISRSRLSELEKLLVWADCFERFQYSYYVTPIHRSHFLFLEVIVAVVGVELLLSSDAICKYEQKAIQIE